ncbi:InlB B-repeat-containing protein [Paenibacillus lignilyticus]|uniref:InlB B-repeat-containing protein n=1 Tax=Paenibacillus lignilyticus TaxID=1172615 RepID=A0ABS5CLE0_9BACL|nr:InlB B-repeat-containing protein [Paenibacillus lignilyticus]MBP3966683.1 InlB B-repeat-containing protein [Paenibacillus lignilyticus]
MRTKKMNRICAWLITAAMLSGMLPTSAWAGAPGAQVNGLNNYVVKLSSDPSTSARPSTFGTASDDGRVWADKSVSVNETQFDVTLSVLAQEYVRTATTEVRAQAAADVAMVLDMSASMTADRVTRMKDAVNKGIETIMAANPRNRIGIYYYGLASGNTSSTPNVGTLFPLASYSTSATGDKSAATDRYVTSSGQTITRKSGVTQKFLDGATGTTTSQTIYTSSGTATQFGLYTGITALKTDIATRQKSSADTERVPYVLLLTDGEANRAYPNWYNSPPNGTEKTGSGASGTAEISALTILSAAKLKDELKQAYMEHSGGKDVVWFNVAFGLTEGNNLATAILKPGRLASATTGDEKSVYDKLPSLTSGAAAAYNKYGIGGAPGYVYSKDYTYFVAPSDLSKVDEAIEDLAGLVEAATQEKIIPFEQTNGSGEPLNIVVTDVLGTGMELKTAPKMGTVTGTVKSSSGSVKTYGFPDLNTTVVYNSATREVKWIIPPKEVPLITFSDRKAPTPGHYSNPNLLPVQLTYAVGLKDAYGSETLYSNEYAGAGVATATTRFIPVEDNPYYYKSITTVDGTIVSERKEIGTDITASVPKSSNTTGTAAASYTYQWDVEGADNVFATKLGNNGKIAPVMKIEMAPASGSVSAGESAIYHITVTNLTNGTIANVIVNDVLPSGLTFVSGSITEGGVSKPAATFPYTISSVPANGSVELTLKAAVPSNATVGTEYINSATITSVSDTSLTTPASVSSDKVTVANTFSPSVTIKLDGANYIGQSVELWKDGASQYTLAASGATHSASNVTPGTYDIYVNGVDTGERLSDSNATKVIHYYTVSFYDGAQKYDTPAAQTILSGGQAVLPSAPTKVGYTFDKWVTSDSGTTAFDFNTAITSITNIYATWAPNTNTGYKVNHYQAAVDGSYSAAPTVENLSGTTGGTTTAVAQTYTGFTAVAFSQGSIAADGSTVVNIYYTRNLYDITFVIDPIKGTAIGDTTPKVRYGVTPTAPGITSEPGYAFTGWDKTLAPVTGDETYTAQFDLTDFSITYDLDGGSVAVANPATYTVESAGITLTNPTRAGFTFSGWTGTGLSNPTITVTIAQGSTGVRNYVAQWAPNTNTAYKVNHYKAAVDGSYSAAPTIENLSGTTGGTTTAVAQTYTGFTAVAFSQGTIAADGSTVVNIYYTRNLYDITFVIDPIKGTAIGDTTPKVRYEATPTAPGITGRPGYAFTGWDKTLAPVTGNETYTAQFDLTDFSITYNLDHGTVNPSNPTTYTAMDDGFTLTNPTKTGYTFAGWTGTGLSEPTSTVAIEKGSTGDRNYTATWTANSSIVTLDDNGGSGGNGGVTATYDQPMPAATVPSQAGYTFVGYFDQTSGGTKYYNADMSSAKNWDKTDSSVTLYAVWTEIGQITIQYAANNTDYGTVSPTYESLNPETGTVTGSEATAKLGYHFVEWQGANGNTVSTSAAFVPQKDSGSYAAATYTAVFAADIYNITYNLNSGTTASSNPTTYTALNDDFTLINPTKLGYTFTGWTGTGLSEPTLTVKVEKGSTGDRAYTATWQVVPVTEDYIVIGTVVDDDTPPDNIPGATVEILKGNTQYGDTSVTDADGKFVIYNVPAGIYDLKITLGEKTAIIAVTIGGDEQVVQLGNVVFPYNASSGLKLVGNGTPAIVIDNLHPEAVDYLFNEYGNTGFAKVEMKIEKIDEETNDSDKLNAIMRINTKAQNEDLTIGLYLDMSIEKFYRITEAVSWNSEGLIGQTNGLIKVIIPIPSELHGKSGYTIYRYHGNAVNVINTVPNTDGEYLVLDNSDWTLTLYVKNFSVYAIAYNTPQVQNPPIFGGATNFAVTFKGDGGTPLSTTQSVALGELLTKPADPIRAGYNFAGWYKADGSAWNFSTDKVYSDITLTAKWTDIPALDKVNHFAYMKGYPDKTFGPQKNMTRAEVTVMFARLLVEKMDVDKTYSSQFKDIDPAKWYASAIGYMEQYGIIKGYSDGTFKPDAPITRAEFAAIASRFDELIIGEPVIFTDVTDSYWARDYISFAAAKGWIKGYPDGTFKPGNYITRAEVVSLVNRMLERYSDRSYVDSNRVKINQYVDLTSKHWAYYDIVEATNSHHYDKAVDSETWTSHTK